MCDRCQFSSLGREMVSAFLWQLYVEITRKMLWSQESKTEKKNAWSLKTSVQNDNPEGNLDKNQTE